MCHKRFDKFELCRKIVYQYASMVTVGFICSNIFYYFRKDLKFVSETEKEMKALVEAVNKVSKGNLYIQIFKAMYGVI